MHKKLRSTKSTEGGVLIAAILTVAILAAISGTVLVAVGAKHQGSFQSVAWREALVSAESGVHRALAELRTTIDDPTRAWDGWTIIDANGVPASVQNLSGY